MLIIIPWESKDQIPDYTRKDFAKVCPNWPVLSKHISHLTEQELVKYIKIEKESLNRTHILQRLYSRYSKLRRERETKALLS